MPSKFTARLVFQVAFFLNPRMLSSAIGIQAELIKRMRISSADPA